MLIPLVVLRDGIQRTRSQFVHLGRQASHMILRRLRVFQMWRVFMQEECLLATSRRARPFADQCHMDRPLSMNTNRRLGLSETSCIVCVKECKGYKDAHSLMFLLSLFHQFLFDYGTSIFHRRTSLAQVYVGWHEQRH